MHFIFVANQDRESWQLVQSVFTNSPDCPCFCEKEVERMMWYEMI